MKILWVEPGANYATQDVSIGLMTALQKQGHNVGLYLLRKHIVDADEFLYMQWRRQGRPEDRHPTRADILWVAGNDILPRALKYEADWVVVVAGGNLHPDWVVLLRRAGVKVALLLTESPYEDIPQGRVAAEATLCFTNERCSVEVLRQVQPNTYYLPHSYDPGRHFPLKCPQDGHDVVFVGTGWRERIAMLHAVNWAGIDLGLYGNWRWLGSRNHLRANLRGGEMPNDAAVALYRQARIGLNLYRQRLGYGESAQVVERAESMNPRAVELAACGVFTLSDERAEVREVFGDAVPLFHSAEELEHLIHYYLTHEDERRELAARLPNLVQGRTFANRAQFLVETLHTHSANGRN